MRPVHREVGKFGHSEQQGAMDTMSLQQQQQQQQQLSQSPVAPAAVVPPIVGSAFSPTRRVGARGGPQLFAQKLFTLVEEEDPEIVEWLPDGLAFRVKDIARFSTEVLEEYFNHSKFTSFQRQLNLYQFKRRKGAHAGAFHHPCFRRGQRHLLSKVRQQKVKRNLAVEARAAQRLARARESDSHHAHRSSEQLSGRGRTRAASQADMRPVQNEDDGDLSDGDFEAGSRRSALRRRVDAGPSRDLSGLCSEGIDGPRHTCWSKDGPPGMGRLSDAGRGWGDDWRHNVSGSPERAPRLLHDPSTPASAQSSDYTASSPSGSTTSDGSSSSSSLGASPPQHSDLFHASTPQSHFDDDLSHCETPAGDSNSPLSMRHSPAHAAVTAVQAAQVTPSDKGLSLAAAVDATTGTWQNSASQHAKQQRPFEPFAWGRPGSETEAPWSEPAQQGTTSQPHHEDFGFIDLFAENWEAGEDAATTDPPPGPASPIMDDGRMEAFMKEAEATGVFGIEEFFLPRGGGGGGGVYGPAAFA